MEGRCESNCGRDEVYPDIFGDEEKTELKLDMTMMMTDRFSPNRLSRDLIQIEYDRVSEKRSVEIN